MQTVAHVVAECRRGAGLSPLRSGLELRAAAGSATIKLPVDVRKWLPGDAVYDGTIYIPETCRRGAIACASRCSTRGPGSPPSNSPSRACEPDGWYDVGSISIE